MVAISLMVGSFSTGQTQAPGVTTTASSTGARRTCGFESRSICGYKQDTTDQFNWTWKSGRTSTVGTGPTNDHTYGTSRGNISKVDFRQVAICNSQTL